MNDTTTTRELPKGWRWVRLGEVAGITGGIQKTPERAPVKLHKSFLTVRNVRHGSLDLSVVERFEVTPKEFERCRLQAGDLLLVEGNGSKDHIGRNAVFQEDGEWIHQNHIIRVRLPAESFSPEFISHFLSSNAGRALLLEKAQTTTGLYTLSTGKVAALEVPVPPPAEQRRIAGVLREQMGAVARARAALEAQLAAAEALPAAHLCAVFQSPQAQRWPRKRLEEVAELLPSKSVASDGDTEVRAITTACLTETGFRAGGIKTSRMRRDDVAASTVKPGEVLVARSNTPDLVGRVAMFTGEEAGIVASDLTIRIWPADADFGQFLTRYLSFLYLSGYWKERAGGASGSMKKITRSQIESEPVPYPPSGEQRAIAARLATDLATVTRLRLALADQLAAVERLPAALLRRAFAGEV
ncbi:MAG: restriction endonuclease subunit S [Verrucomicrobiae bacterium]|nr:restriction endonuclease subunit S [Verrucomicrobiae bacterium]